MEALWCQGRLAMREVQEALPNLIVPRTNDSHCRERCICQTGTGDFDEAVRAT